MVGNPFSRVLPPPQVQIWSRHYLAYMLATSMDAPMFPDEAFRQLNVGFLAQTTVALVYCAATGRWFSDAAPPRTWVLAQLQAWAALHILWYTAELALTSMATQFPPMAAHHVVSIGLMGLLMRRPGSMCFWTLLPCVCHALLWAWDCSLRPLLGLYNAALLLVGAVMFRHWAARGGPAVGFSWLSPVVVMLLAGVNYFTYCTSYQGAMCLPPLWTDPREPIWPEMLVTIALLWTTGVAVYCRTVMSATRQSRLGAKGKSL